jgi:hypothetical protein
MDEEECGGTVELTHEPVELEHSIEPHVDPYIAVLWTVRTE